MANSNTALIGMDFALEESQTATVIIVKDSEDLYNFFDSDDILDQSWAETFKLYNKTNSSH